MVSSIRKLSDKGASLVEYSLLVALIAVVCLGAVSAAGGNTASIFNRSALSVAGLEVSGITQATPGNIITVGFDVTPVGTTAVVGAGNLYEFTAKCTGDAGSYGEAKASFGKGTGHSIPVTVTDGAQTHECTINGAGEAGSGGGGPVVATGTAFNFDGTLPAGICNSANYDENGKTWVRLNSTSCISAGAISKGNWTLNFGEDVSKVSVDLFYDGTFSSYIKVLDAASQTNEYFSLNSGNLQHRNTFSGPATQNIPVTLTSNTWYTLSVDMSGTSITYILKEANSGTLVSSGSFTNHTTYGTTKPKVEVNVPFTGLPVDNVVVN